MIPMRSTLGSRAMVAAITIILGAAASAEARTYVVNDRRDHLGHVHALRLHPCARR